MCLLCQIAVFFWPPVKQPKLQMTQITQIHKLCERADFSCFTTLLPSNANVVRQYTTSAFSRIILSKLASSVRKLNTVRRMQRSEAVKQNTHGFLAPNWWYMETLPALFHLNLFPSPAATDVLAVLTRPSQVSHLLISSLTFTLSPPPPNTWATLLKTLTPDCLSSKRWEHHHHHPHHTSTYNFAFDSHSVYYFLDTYSI